MKRRSIVLAGGGTLGSVTSLLALVELANNNNRNYDFVWFGTWRGPERFIVAPYHLPYYRIASGKLRRYWSAKNVTAPLFVFVGFLQTVGIFIFGRPSLVISAGAYVAVPVVWAAWCFRIPVLLHEQDKRDGLALQLVRFTATVRTSVWAKEGTTAIGNLIPPSIYEGDVDRIRKHYALPAGLPVVLVIGGGTGALAINSLLLAALPELTKRVFVLHITGKGKKVDSVKEDRYRAIELVVGELPDMYAVASVVITRAGMGTLSGLAQLRKPAIVIPMPHSHQEENASFLAANHAAVVMPQAELTADTLRRAVFTLLDNEGERVALGEALHKLIKDGTNDYLALVDSELGRKPL
ncbi:hypothetical protein COV04_02685 [Candidatus Uhrbacteria bacterium CG10_big_fil_rev_8_21_14_0_10_48_11]|uniref:UDP-N-acetylglucosamine--N-acetylmuramyl-(pentapeptide) pyrophosphoryl-undecaprenol N-acetylglucosamine transferase n=1 Tax=Candidatus Uhrbacteria bacterium CG10_big_fil_rev_8_21_14_0_10_48_11 TaxID=1975037 RepID=A0A2M8LEM1_9BACT|nr:MAG: hypothetical protein COV04_02685 [Candidatus Uhrbacteria bacterium CG10_big_fil_rev_8_21_14_0_10_48_11]